MTPLLERAMNEASALSATDQDCIASLMLAEIETEQRWSRAFAASQDKLAKFADEALREFHAGKTLPMNLASDEQFSRAPRPTGLCAGEFVVPDDLDAPLPWSALESFRGGDAL